MCFGNFCPFTSLHLHSSIFLWEIMLHFSLLVHFSHLNDFFHYLWLCIQKTTFFCRNYTWVDEIVVRLNSQPLSLKMVVFHLLKICHAFTGLSKRLLFTLKNTIFKTLHCRCQAIHKKFLRRFDTIFGLKMMVKSVV